MKRLVSWLTSSAVLLSAIATVVAPVQVHAAAQAESKAETPAATVKAADKEVVYSYIAQNGDSYSLMARKAVQTYGAKNKVKLSQAKIIAAETWLTQAAGSPQLAVQQKVTIKEAAVKDSVEKAQKLSATQEAAWNVYAAGVNFNTNAVGQSK